MLKDKITTKGMERYSRCWIPYLFTLVMLWTPGIVNAHPFQYGAIKTRLDVQENIISLRTEVPQTITIGGVPDHQAQREFFAKYLSKDFSIEQSGQNCPFTLTVFNNSSASNETVFEGEFTCFSPVSAIEELEIKTSVFSDYFQNFDHFVSFSINEKKWELVFGAANTEYPTDTPARYGGTMERFAAVAGRFTWLGILHIWTGYDHILFLLSAILLLRSVKKILILVTSFTVAHSVTLILAGLGVVTLSPGIVEPLIALSIAYMAFRNIYALSKNEQAAKLNEQWITTFGFGLIHGLGFAGMLLEIDIPSEFFVPSLIIFNIGIEIGQLAILLVAVPALFYIDKLPHRRKILSACSVIIALLALYWFFERVFA